MQCNFGATGLAGTADNICACDSCTVGGSATHCKNSQSAFGGAWLSSAFINGAGWPQLFLGAVQVNAGCASVCGAAAGAHGFSCCAGYEQDSNGGRGACTLGDSCTG